MSGVFGEVQVSPQQEKRAISDNRKTKCFALGHPPDPDKDFYIPNAADVEYIATKIIQNGNKYLVRGPPACGKTTLALALCRRYPYTNRDDVPSFVLIRGEDLKAPNNEEEAVKCKFVAQLKTATNQDLDTDELKPAFSWLNVRNVVVVVDEAQIVFQKLYSQFKNSDATALFFTTTPELAITSKTFEDYWLHSPSELAAKYYWSGRINNSEVVKALKQTNARLGPKAVEALVQISGEHRGVFVRLCDWVRQHQSTPQA